VQLLPAVDPDVLVGKSFVDISIQVSKRGCWANVMEMHKRCRQAVLMAFGSHWYQAKAPDTKCTK
jgi:hypothetical protein